MRFRWITVGLLASSVPLTGTAQEAAHREVGAHVHGEAEISIVLDGKQLTIELHSPLFNILGFEHAPSTADERTVAAAASRSLSNSLLVAAPSPAALCKLVSSDAALPFADHDDHGQHGKDGHHDEHDDAHRHSDIVVSYVFDCAQRDRLTQVDITALGTFPRIKTADVVFLGPNTQRSRKLDAASSVFRLN